VGRRQAAPISYVKMGEEGRHTPKKQKKKKGDGTRLNTMNEKVAGEEEQQNGYLHSLTRIKAKGAERYT